jgi:hypothetical protein
MRIVVLVGMVMVSLGSVSAMTVTVNAQFALWPQESVAMQVTTLVPTGKTLPEGGLQTSFGAGSQSSLTVTV